MKTIFFIILFLPGVSLAAAAGYRLDRSPHDPRDVVSLQAGARTYVNYCLGCHSLQYMRYQGLTELGISEAQVKEYLLFTADKIGDLPIGTTRELTAKEARNLRSHASPP